MLGVREPIRFGVQMLARGTSQKGERCFTGIIRPWFSVLKLGKDITEWPGH